MHTGQIGGVLITIQASGLKGRNGMPLIYTASKDSMILEVYYGRFEV